MVLKGGKVLLGLRNPDPEKASSALHGEGTWTMPGGKMDFRESPHACARRELLEETGLSPKSLEIFSVTSDAVHDAHFITLGFICRSFEGEAVAREPEEIVEWKWFPLAGVPENMFPPSRKMMDNFIDGIVYSEVD